MEPLKRVREEFEFHIVWTYYEKIMHKDVNDNKIKTLRLENKTENNGKHLCWKSRLPYFV